MFSLLIFVKLINNTINGELWNFTIIRLFLRILNRESLVFSEKIEERKILNIRIIYRNVKLIKLNETVKHDILDNFLSFKF